MANERYVAIWCSRRHRDPDGEWNPDRDEFTESIQPTKAEAEKVAVRGSKRCGIEWLSVRREILIDGKWQDAYVWSGDWDGLEPVGYALDPAAMAGEGGK